MSEYKPPDNPNIHDMSLEELIKFKKHLIDKIEVHLPELIDDIDVYIEQNLIQMYMKKSQ
jgi:hypothetical protein